MPGATLEHFKRAAMDIGAHGDNDTLPFDIDNRFVKDNQDALAELAYDYFSELEKGCEKSAKNAISALQVFSERLLVPTGPAGFRITTKIHPFWNIYINGIGVAIAEKHEMKRSDKAHSYRYAASGKSLFDRERNWRAYRECTLSNPNLKKGEGVVVQTDISSFYEHIYHHRLKNHIGDLFPESTMAVQIDRFLSKFASGRSFGLPVGGQCARILAEIMMSPIDRRLSDKGVVCHRYVDDFTIITKSHEDAYRALAVLSHALADYGLSLNRTKTTILRAKHYVDYVNTQLGTFKDESSKLREIDLYFDPYSDSADVDYNNLRDTVRSINTPALLELETKKGLPDTFLVAQIARTLELQTPPIAIKLCETLLDPKYLNAFRASWSKIMRGIAKFRGETENGIEFDYLDKILDKIPDHSPHLLLPDANCLHYLRTIRFRRTHARAQYVLEVYENTRSKTVKRACIDCWRKWGNRDNFIRLRNQWETLGVEEQRMLWLAAGEFGDDGKHARIQLRTSVLQAWTLGIERKENTTFGKLYLQWCKDGV